MLQLDVLVCGFSSTVNMCMPRAVYLCYDYAVLIGIAGDRIEIKVTENRTLRHDLCVVV